MAVYAERVTSEIFPDGTRAELYRLSNSAGFQTEISNLGGAVVSIWAPDKNGTLNDVVLGFDSLKEYYTSSTLFGVIVGRYANRISGGKIVLDNQQYELTKNFGKHHIHGGNEGFQSKIWAVEKIDTDEGPGLRLFYVSADGEEGYPGKLSVTVTYQVTEENELIIDYNAITDKKTVLNLTNHSFFNLLGAGNGDILDHILQLNADAYTPLSDKSGIPTGEIESVEGTPLDFRQPLRIGDRIDENHPQMRYGRGYDHNYVLNNSGNNAEFAAEVFEPRTGRKLQVFTTEPGLQFYSGNFLDGTEVGKGGIPYNMRDGLCLETQHFPDSPNNPTFPLTVLNPGDRYQSRTIYKFSAT